MNLAFLCRWKLEDGLTVSTVTPYLQFLVDFPNITKIILITLEDAPQDSSNAAVCTLINNRKVKWMPLTTSRHQSKILGKIADYRNGCKQLKKIAIDNDVHVVVAHGAPAGSVANKALKGMSIPYYVTLFEPHADYMHESGVWSKYGLKYRLQKRWEYLQKKHATGLMPVSECFRNKLIEEGVPSQKVFVIPSSVNAVAFEVNEQHRLDMRRQLHWKNAVIGIYVGKFGGLYYNREAFQIYRLCFKLIPDFRLIILSPQPREEIVTQLKNFELNLSWIHINSVPHGQVPAFLSAADFAFATYKPGPSKKYLSPVKIGEYWANGLPVLLTEGVGDDSDIIKKEGGGALFNLQEEGSVEKAIRQILEILENPQHRQEIPELAQKYRSPERLKEAFEYFFGKAKEEGADR
ncbi:glycosyltransferase [Pontibacter sp. H249]|uniref:glycosyltransferase n=1 Tax=Pontibacter sp. H249 TaxID=3133420 RepID=UPI0030BDC87D